MTIEKAIRLIKFQLARFGRTNIKSNKTIVELLQLSLAALLEQAERENPRRLTIEQLKGINGPVWLSCKTLEGTNGYWCLCHNGLIICPSGTSLDVEEIPHWNFYRYERKEI